MEITTNLRSVTSLPLEQLKWFSWKELNLFDCIELWKITWQKLSCQNNLLAPSRVLCSLSLFQASASVSLTKSLEQASVAWTPASRLLRGERKKERKKRSRFWIHVSSHSFRLTAWRACSEIGSRSFFHWLLKLYELGTIFSLFV